MDQGYRANPPVPPSAPKYFGAVDEISEQAISGYVVSLHDVSRHPVVQVECTGCVVGSARCDLFRADLLHKGVRDGRCGFSVPIDKPLPSSVPSFRVFVLDEDGEFDLRLDPGVLTRHVAPSTVPGTATPTIVDNDALQHPQPGKITPQPIPSPSAAPNLSGAREEADRLWLAGRWLDAQASYLAHVTTATDDAVAWQRIGDCAREQGDLINAEAAQRVATFKSPESAAVHLAHGDALKALGRLPDAAEAYQRSFARHPSRAAGTRAEALGWPLDLMRHVAPLRHAVLCLEVSDMLQVLFEQQHVSGIQRVQLGLASHVLHEGSSPEGLPSELVIWGGDHLYVLSKPTLLQMLDSMHGHGASLDQRRNLIQTLQDGAVLFQPQPGDIFFATGAMWMPQVRGDVTPGHSRLKRAGVRLGMYLYDLIPLTNPEFCHPYLTERFSVTLADTLLHCDFALAISGHVAAELTLALDRAGYPAIPTIPVPLAHSFGAVRAGAAGGQGLRGSPAPIIIELRATEYVLAVSSISAHKNHALLLQVWQILLQDEIEPPHLVIVGKRGYGSDDFFRQLETTHFLEGRVHVLEDVSDETLSQLYDGCLFTMFPSFTEGWGLPVGESLAHGKVCIASRTASMPEVGGDFALYIDPYNARGCAEVVAGLLADRPALREHEKRIRTNFQPRTWTEFGDALLRTIRALGQPQSAAAPRIALGPNRTLQPCPPERGWTSGTRLPSRDALVERTLRRMVLAFGWTTLEQSGTRMTGAISGLVIPVEAAPGEAVPVILQLRVEAHGRTDVRITVTSSCGAAVSSTVTQAGDMPLHLCGVVDGTGNVELRVVAEQNPTLAGPAARIALVRLMVAPACERLDEVPAYRLLRTTSLVGGPGVAVPPWSGSSLVTSLRRTAVLLSGWQAPGASCTWMDGSLARIRLGTEEVSGTIVRVALKLQTRPGKQLRVTATAECGATATVSTHAGDQGGFMLWIDCRSGDDGRVLILLRASEPDAARTRGIPLAPVAIAALVYGKPGAALTEAVLFPPPEPDTKQEILSAGLCFTVTGHIKGSYSLAAVNRSLALALEAHSPGAVRIEQVEGTPMRDLSDMPAPERQALAALASRPPHADGPEVVIAQHWPVLTALPAADLRLAFVFWEESLVPRDMVRQLNSAYAGVLAPTRSVAKALIDSGVSLPVWTVGMAPNLHPFTILAEGRMSSGPRTPSKIRPFTLLHVSSCFPRKGADALLRAFAQAFTVDDPVRLVIKTFPNPHNDIVQQLAALQAREPAALNISVINRDLALEEMLDLYETADAMVLPTRGEGYNLPAAEAMAAGLPLIVTGVGGHTDFVSSDTCRTIDYSFAASRSHLNSPGSVWVDPDINDLSAAMREALAAAGTGITGARVHAGRDVAARLTDGGAWSRRITDAAASLLCAGKPIAPKVAVVTTWKIRCGIAEYSRMLLEQYPDAVRDVTVLCNDNTAIAGSENGRHPPAVVAWRNQDPSSMDRLALAIEDTRARVVLVQHHFSLIGPHALTLLLTDKRLAGCHFVITLHNVHDLFACDPPRQERLTAALEGVSRILVHTVRDLNFLKSHGLVGNVTLFPHGVNLTSLTPRPPRPLPPEAAPLIGAYGFILPHKNFGMLIEAFVDIRRQWPGARLRMVTAEYPDPSSAAELTRCRTLAADLELESVIEWHTNYLPDEQSLALLNECDLVILPYKNSSESSSASVHTAIASRTPIVVTPVSIFDNVEGLVFRLNGVDVSSIAKGVIWVLQEHQSRCDMQDKITAWLSASGWDKLAERLQGMLTGIVAQEVWADRLQAGDPWATESSSSGQDASPAQIDLSTPGSPGSRHCSLLGTLPHSH